MFQVECDKFTSNLQQADIMVQPVPWKVRLEMLKEMQIETLNGGKI